MAWPPAAQGPTETAGRYRRDSTLVSEIFIPVRIVAGLLGVFILTYLLWLCAMCFRRSFRKPRPKKAAAEIPIRISKRPSIRSGNSPGTPNTFGGETFVEGRRSCEHEGSVKRGEKDIAINHFEYDDGGDQSGPPPDIQLYDMAPPTSETEDISNAPVPEHGEPSTPLRRRFTTMEVGESDPTNISDLPQPRPHRAFKKDPSPNYMTMGLRKLDIRNWLTVDNTYPEFYAARDFLLKTQNEEVIQCVPEGEEAAGELLTEVVKFLSNKYPQFFKVVRIHDRTIVKNKIVNEECTIDPLSEMEMHPLEICARLAMEDFNLLVRNEVTGEHHLVGSATLFPAGWHLPKRIGVSITALHSPVPQWKDLPNILNLSYFSRLSKTSCMERSSYFIQTRSAIQSLASTLFVQEPKDFFNGTWLSAIDPRYIIVRRERQTFRRLGKTGAIVFTVKTSIQSLTDLSEEERTNLATEIRSWPKDVKRYKGIDLWGRAVLAYCDGVSMKVVEDVTVFSNDASAQW